MSEVNEENVKLDEIQETDEISDLADNVETAESEVLSDEEQKIKALEEENNVLADKVLRAQAELQNVQRRQAKETSDLLKYKSQKLAESLLPVLDSLEHALKVEVSDEQGIQLKKGIEMAYNNFINALQNEGIEKIESLNQPFDPTKHQAIQQIPANEDQEADIVVNVFQEGFKLHDRVIRPAMVVVTTK